MMLIIDQYPVDDFFRWPTPARPSADRPDEIYHTL